MNLPICSGRKTKEMSWYHKGGKIISAAMELELPDLTCLGHGNSGLVYMWLSRGSWVGKEAGHRRDVKAYWVVKFGWSTQLYNSLDPKICPQAKNQNSQVSDRTTKWNNWLCFSKQQQNYIVTYKTKWVAGAHILCLLISLILPCGNQISENMGSYLFIQTASPCIDTACCGELGTDLSSF